MTSSNPAADQPAAQQQSIFVNGSPLNLAAGTPSLLAALKEAGIFVPSGCGGRGYCGLCQVKVRAGGGQPTAAEKNLLGDVALQAGDRLACQVTPAAGMRVEIPASYFRAREFRAQLLERQALTPAICQLRLQLIDLPELDFQPGQYLQARIPPHDSLRRPLERAFSFALPPAGDRLELIIKRVRNGYGSVYLCDRLPIGGRLTLNGPHGHFVLRPESRSLLFIAGGSGMAPIKAMLLDMAGKGDKRSARFFFGAATEQDLFQLDVMRSLETRLPDFKFIPVLSEAAADWTGERGRVTDALARHLSPTAGRTMDAYLCGSPAMIEGCSSLLCNHAFTPGRIFHDAFVKAANLPGSK